MSHNHQGESDNDSDWINDELNDELNDENRIVCRQRKRKYQPRRDNMNAVSHNYHMDDSDNGSDHTDDKLESIDEKQMLLVQSEVYANEIVSNLKSELLEKRARVNNVTIDEMVATRTLTVIHRLCLRFMRSNRSQVRPNEDVLIKLNHHGFHINKQIVLGFSVALGLLAQKTLGMSSFSGFLQDSRISRYTRSKLLLALQAFANKNYKKYRLFVFSSDNGRIPDFKGNRIETHSIALGIYIKNDQVYVITNVSRLFNTENNIYCPDCSTSFNRTGSYVHKKSCPLRCPNCCMYGYNYPCKNENVLISCRKCNRDFNNTQCFESHKGVVCNKVKCCPSCAETYVIDRATYRHQCNFSKCSFCKKFHARAAKCVY